MSSSNRPQFLPVDMIQKSWETLKSGGGPLIVGTLVFVIALGVVGRIPVLRYAAFLIEGPFLYGLYKTALAASRGQKTDFPDVFAGFQNPVPPLVAGILVGIFTTIGFFLCVVPGFAVSVLYSTTYIFMAEERLDFWPAMEKSRLLVMDNFGQWLLLFLALFGLNIVGFFALCVGLLVTIPMSFIVVAMAYDMERGASTPVPPLPVGEA